MITTILISVYVLSIFLCRYSYRMQYIWGHWSKTSCGISLAWFIPIVNIILSIVYLLMGYTAKERAYKYKLPNWFTNQDL